MMARHFFDTVGKRIRVLRQDIGLNQQELTAELERYGAVIGPSYVSELERTDKVPSAQVLAALAQALNTTTDYLLLLTDDPVPPGEEEEEAPARLLHEPPASYEVGELWRIASELPAEDLDHLLWLARLIRDSHAPPPRIVE